MIFALIPLFSLVCCNFACEEVYLKDQDISVFCYEKRMCAKEGRPCITDWMGVCGDWKEKVEDDVREDESMNLSFVLLPLCVLFLFWVFVWI